jgi:hypothetical protein
MKPVIISVSSLINCNKKTTFQYFYELDKFLGWYNDPPNVIIESINDFTYQEAGYKQVIFLANRAIQFEAEVIETSVNNYISGNICGFINGSFNWKFIEIKDATHVQKDLIITGDNWLKHLVALTAVRIGDKLHCKKAFKRLNVILSESGFI